MENKTTNAWCPECYKNVDFIISPFTVGLDFLTCPFCKETFRIIPLYGESYRNQWGKVDVKDKVILDIGADYGSTADFFLLRGAKRVIAIEGDQEYYKSLVHNSELIPGIVPCFCFINSPNDITSLLISYKPDIVKSDCEGCEIHLAGVPRDVFRIPEDYIVEVHQHNVYNIVMPKFKECGYEILDVNEWLPEAARKEHGFVPIVWAHRV